MSRAFVRDDNEQPQRRFALPERDEPSFPAAAAYALLDAACDGETAEAEEATGFRWGEPALRKHVQRMLDQALDAPESERDDRFILVARRFLRAAPR